MAKNQLPQKPQTDLAFYGFLEVAMNDRTILKNIKLCKEDIKIINQMFWFW